MSVRSSFPIYIIFTIAILGWGYNGCLVEVNGRLEGRKKRTLHSKSTIQLHYKPRFSLLRFGGRTGPVG